MIFIFITCALIALYILDVVVRSQEDKDTKIFELELELKMKEEQHDALNDKYRKLEDGMYKLAETVKKKIK